MNKLIYILIIFILLFIIININIINILILIIIFIGGYIYYNIYEKKNDLKEEILNKFEKFIIFKKFNIYTYNNSKNYIKLFIKKTHYIDDLENIRIIIINNLLSFKINISYKLHKLLNKYINNLNIYLIKYIKEQNYNYKGHYLQTSNYNNRFDYY